MSEAKDRVLGTLRRVLQQTTLRAILRPLDKVPIDVSREEAETLLAPFEAQIENDFVMCCEVVNQVLALSHGPQAEPMPEPANELLLSTED